MPFQLRLRDWPTVAAPPFVLVDQPAQDPPPPDSRRRKLRDSGHGDVTSRPIKVVAWPLEPGAASRNYQA
jgi:hypothetical protein